MPKINVSAKVIYDLSAGIYRSPANALKELISNAFDADADKVVIRTNRPFYKTITYYDDGDGMEPNEFQWAMNHIGGTRKREGGRRLFTKKRRPIIGKIGIGILAVAQICKSFSFISTKKGVDKKFEALVDLKKFDEPEVYKLVLGDEKIPIGEYELITSDEDKKEHYTKIILHEIREDFKSDLEDKRADFIDYSRPKKGQGSLFKSPAPKDFRNFVEWLSNRDIRKLRDYWRLIWELALFSPIEYFSDGPILNVEVFEKKKNELANYGLKLDVDGFILKKPILLPVDKDIKERGVDYDIYMIDSKKEGIDESELRFTGYLFNQRKQIKNTELQGILIRLKNVAIGKYDKSYLNCPISLGPIANFNSGEIYIEHGLEEALNIDRNSFKESHVQYKRLQKYVYELMSIIYRDTRKRSAERNEARKHEKYLQERKRIHDSVALLTRNYQINQPRVKYDASEAPEVPVRSTRGLITIYPKHKIFESKKIDKMLLEKFLVFLEINKHHDLSSEPDYYKALIEFLKK